MIYDETHLLMVNTWKKVFSAAQASRPGLHAKFLVVVIVLTIGQARCLFEYFALSHFDDLLKHGKLRYAVTTGKPFKGEFCIHVDDDVQALPSSVFIAQVASAVRGLSFGGGLSHDGSP